MELLPKELEETLPKLYETENTPTTEKTLIIRYISIYSNFEWYLCEFDKDTKTAFGYVISGLGEDCNEWGYFNLEEMENINKDNLQIIREESFKPIKFKELKGK